MVPEVARVGEKAAYGEHDGRRVCCKEGRSEFRVVKDDSDKYKTV